MSITEQTLRLEEIKQEMQELFDEAVDIIQEASREIGADIIYERAKAYWIAQMKMAMDRDHDYLGGCPVTFQKTIEELEDSKGEEEDGD